MPNEPISAEDLAELLVEQGFAEERRGFGHATGEDIAAWLTERFVITDRGGNRDIDNGR